MFDYVKDNQNTINCHFYVTQCMLYLSVGKIHVEKLNWTSLISANLRGQFWFQLARTTYGHRDNYLKYPRFSEQAFGW